MKIIENEYGKFGLEVWRDGSRKEYIDSSLHFRIIKDENLEKYRPFIKPKCFDEFEAEMKKNNYSAYPAYILKDELLNNIKEEVYNGAWEDYKIYGNGFSVMFKINNLINIEFGLDFSYDWENSIRRVIEISKYLKNNLKERKKVLNRLDLFNPKAKTNKYGYQHILMPDIRIRYFVLDKDNNIMFLDSGESISGMIFNNSLSYIDSIIAIKWDSCRELYTEMQIETKDGSFKSYGYIYPDTGDDFTHPPFIGHFIR